MTTDLLIKLEIALLLISFVYLAYYLGQITYKIYFNIKKLIIRDDLSETKVSLNVVDFSAKEEIYKKEVAAKKLTNDDIRQVRDLLKRARIKISHSKLDEAKSLIIEGLALDKNSIELNLELAQIYEKEGNYSNSQYIYCDILERHKDSTEIRKKLGYAYYAQGLLDESLKEYLKVLKKNPGDDESINMLPEISYDMKDWPLTIKYTGDFLKFKPKDITKLTMRAIAYESLRNFKEAIEVYKKILEIQPYNSFSRDKLRELQ